MKKKYLMVVTLVLASVVALSGCKKEAPSSEVPASGAESSVASGAVYEAEAEVTIDLSGSQAAAGDESTSASEASSSETSEDASSSSTAE